MRGRGTAIGEGVTWAARWSLRLVLVVAGATLLWLLIGQLWSAVLPVLLAVILATVLWPPASWLRRHKFPPLLAAITVLLAGIVVLGGLITLIALSVSGSLGQISDSATAAVGSLQNWLSGPPFNLAEGQLDSYLQQVTGQIQQSISTIASGVLSYVSGLASGVVTGVLTLVLAFLFIKDGPRFLPWVRSVAGDGAGGHLAEVMARAWKTVGEFIRAQAIVSLVDALLIGGGLLVLGVPLALPLAVLTFLAGFVPIVGAIVAGALGVAVALVSNGFTTALIVLALIVVVQQVEGNLLQPVLQSRSLGLHPAVVLLAVTAGSTLYGIAGAFLSVPLTAAAAVVLRYLSEQIDHRVAGGPAPRVDSPLETVQVVEAKAPVARTAEGTAPDPATVPPSDEDAGEKGP